jgi:hypothetical protein
MYEIEAIVTVATPTELKLAGNCPAVWLQAPGFRSTEIARKLAPGKALEAIQEPTQYSEIPGNRGFWPNLQVGDRVILRLFFAGESR